MNETTDIRGDGQQQYWSKRATTYGQQYGLNTYATRMKIKRKVGLMVQYGKINVAENIIELGCGTGLYTEFIARANPKLLSTDISLDMIQEAKKRAKVQFVQMDARKLDIADSSYDSVVATYLFQHVDTSQCLKEVHRILKSEGRLVAIVPNILNPLHYGLARFWLTRKLLKETSHSDDFTRWGWRKILTGHGFKDILVKPIEFTSPFTPNSLVNTIMELSNILENVPVLREFAGTLLIVAEKK